MAFIIGNSKKAKPEPLTCGLLLCWLKNTNSSTYQLSDKVPFESTHPSNNNNNKNYLWKTAKTDERMDTRRATYEKIH